MGKRTNTAKWMESQNRWQINVQKASERRSFYSSTPGRTGQREANAKADAWLDHGVEKASLRVDVLLDEYLATVEARTSACNYRKESYHVEDFMRPLIGKKKICSLTEQDLQSIIDRAYRKTDNKTGKTVERSRKTLQNLRATISAFLKFCRRKKVTSLFPEDLTIPQGARLKGKKVLQPQDLITLFSVDTTLLYGKRVFDEYIYAYRFAVLTGMRPGELRGLRPEDVQGDNIHIQRSINSLNEETRGKNENAIRGLTMSELAKESLDAQLALTDGAETIFDIPSTTTYLHRWTRYCEANGIPHISLYELRHTFVSVVKQLPDGEVKSIIGHSRDMDTFGIYGHEITGEGQKTAGKINDIFVQLLKSVL